MSVGLSAALSIMAVAEDVEVAVCRDASRCSASATSFLSLMLLQILTFSQQLCFLITLLRWFTTSSHGLNRKLRFQWRGREDISQVRFIGASSCRLGRKLGLWFRDSGPIVNIGRQTRCSGTIMAGMYIVWELSARALGCSLISNQVNSLVIRDTRICSHDTIKD